jgi:glycosyltransferase involved in cell wall biosynthesis
MIHVSAVLSTHNRSKLIKRAMSSYEWQTIPRENFEIIFVDDMSTEDIRKTYEHLIGKFNITHIKMDHTKHPIFKQLNPNWSEGGSKNWFHTPAISINLGCHIAEGPVICLCHPEILHAPRNFELAYNKLKNDNAFLFGYTMLGTQESNKLLDKFPQWTDGGWENFVKTIKRPDVKVFTPAELYWYTSFLPKKAVEAVRGVDFEYLKGTCGEDDDFRDRVRIAGWKSLYAHDIQGFHQDHSDEKELHRIRSSPAWINGMKRNRALYFSRKNKNKYPTIVNKDVDWTGSDCVVSIIKHKI